MKKKMVIKFSVLWFDFTLIEQKFCLYIRMVKKTPETTFKHTYHGKIPALIGLHVYQTVQKVNQSLTHRTAL